MDRFTETLRSWHNFYFMTGGATATLVGLMFVALSLGRHLVSEETAPNLQFLSHRALFILPPR